MKNDLEPINIFDFDGTLTTETWPKCWVWAKKFGFNGEKRNDNLEKANVSKYIEVEYYRKECLFAINDLKINVTNICFF